MTTENQETRKTETETETVAVPTVGHICGECHKIAECAMKPGATVTYVSPACDRFKKKRGRPATTVRASISGAAPVPVAPAPAPVAPAEPLPTLDPSQVELVSQYIPPAPLMALESTKQWKSTKNLIEKFLMAPGAPRHLCMMGPAGIGKNEILNEFCREHTWPCITVSCSGDMRASALLGRITAQGEGFTWQDGPLIIAMTIGAVLNLDEVNVLDTDIALILHSVMTTRRLFLANDSRLIIAHPNFRIVATCNPLNYAGTKPMNEALKSRFRFIQMGYDSGIDKKLMARLGLGEIQAESLMKVIRFVRDGFERGEISQPFGHRTLAYIAADVAECNMDLMTALEVNFLNMLTETDRESIKTLLTDLARVAKVAPAPTEPVTEKVA